MLLSGQPLVGAIVAADTNKVIVQTKSGPVEKKSSDIGRIVFENRLNAETPTVELILMDGSKVVGNKLVGKNSIGWRMRETNGREVNVLPKTLRAVLLKPIAPELANAWQSAIQEPKKTDAVIVLRPGNTLDRINGVIIQVQESSVTFDLDGQQIDIPNEKLIGLVWFQRELERIKPTIEVVATSRSKWMAESFDWKSSGLELRTQLGQTLTIPATDLSSIDFATANIRWLSEVESMESVANMQIEFRTPIAGRQRAFAPRFVVNGQSPAPNAQPGDKDLHFPSPGQYMFRMPDGFTSLQCRIERTDSGTDRTDLVIEVWQDDQKIAEQPLPFNRDFVELEVAVKPEKKTKLAVVCNSKLMVGTEVTWKQPRLKR